MLRHVYRSDETCRPTKPSTCSHTYSKRIPLRLEWGVGISYGETKSNSACPCIKLSTRAQGLEFIGLTLAPRIYNGSAAAGSLRDARPQPQRRACPDHSAGATEVRPLAAARHPQRLYTCGSQSGGEGDVGLIDLNAMSTDWSRALGGEASKDYFMHLPAQQQADYTHLQERGGHAVACLVVDSWKQLGS